MHKSVPKVLTFGKVSQEIQKSGGGGGPVLDEVLIKGTFFETVPKLRHHIGLNRMHPDRRPCLTLSANDSVG